MAQHFLLSIAAKSLSLASVFTMKDADAEMTFRCIRWHETDGQPVCPHCGGADAYDCRRLKGAPRFRCRACTKDFSITSGTLFASHKLPLRCYLAAIAIFCNEVKGKSALALSRDLNVSYKCAFVLLHKLREAMAAELKGRVVGGEGKIAEVDGGYFGGYMKPANFRENRRDRRLVRNQNGKRKVVVVVRERGGNSVPAVFKSEAKAMAFLRAHVANGTILNADEAGSWEELHNATRSAGSTTKKRTASTALAPIGPKNFSRACAVPRSATITISRALICSGTRKRLHGAKIIAACRMAIRCSALPASDDAKAESSILADIGSGTSQTRLI